MTSLPKPSEQATYTHGHVPSVLRSHAWRTATNSAAYLLPHLTPSMRILDVGCGPGTITVDLALLVPGGKVVGLEYVEDVLEKGREVAREKKVENVEWVTGDVNALQFGEGEFDIVHAHQVLQHVGDPVQALREMRRVTKSGGIVAARDSDYAEFVWYPASPGLTKWNNLYLRVAAHNGGEPNAGRRLHVWAREAGFDTTKVVKSTGTWCYSSREEVAWWSDLWAERTLKSSFAQTAVEGGLATQADLEEIAEAWRAWGKEEDAWFVVLHGEILCTV